MDVELLGGVVGFAVFFGSIGFRLGMLLQKRVDNEVLISMGRKLHEYDQLCFEEGGPSLRWLAHCINCSRCSLDDGPGACNKGNLFYTEYGFAQDGYGVYQSANRREHLADYERDCM